MYLGKSFFKQILIQITLYGGFPDDGALGVVKPPVALLACSCRCWCGALGDLSRCRLGVSFSHIIILDIELLLLYIFLKKTCFWFKFFCHTFSFIFSFFVFFVVVFFFTEITVQLLVNVVILLIQ